jgi:hypothetical protein
MSLYLTLDSVDGKNTEGIGNICYYHILLFALSKKLGIGFHCENFRNIAHYNYTEYSSKEWDESFTKFFNFPYKNNFDMEVSFTDVDERYFSFIDENKNSEIDFLIKLDSCERTNWSGHYSLMNYCQNNIPNIFTEKTVIDIRDNLIFNETDKYFGEQFNISVHIRIVNPNDVDITPNRELYNKDVDFPRYKNLIHQLKRKYSDREVVLHIHSQGEPQYFSDIVDLSNPSFKINLHLNDHPSSDIYHMAHADLLVMANSSFSLLPHLLNINKTIVRNNFWHFTYPNTIHVDYNYNFNSDLL